MVDGRRRLLIIVSGGCLLVLFLALLLRPRHRHDPAAADAVSQQSHGIPGESSTAAAAGPRGFRRATISPDAPALSAEQIVARKVVQFGQNRRELVHALAKRFNVTVPDDVERFFQAVEGGRWE